MQQTSKPVRYLVSAATLLLGFTLGMRWLDGGSPGELPTVLMAFSLLVLSFNWDGIARMAKN